MIDAASQSQRHSWPRRAAIAALLAVAALCLLLVSAEPSVDRSGPPTARTVEAARGAWLQVQSQPTGVTRIRLGNRELAGVASLAGDALGIDRIDARLVNGNLVAAASLPLPLWGWFNSELRISGDHRGFPDLELSAGRLQLPGWASRAMAETVRMILRWRGARLPPLDELVRQVSVDRQRIVADIGLPQESGLISGLIGVQRAQVDPAAVARIYCRLVSLQRRQPDMRLAEQVRRAFAQPSSEPPQVANRIRFVALALYVERNRTVYLAPEANRLARSCEWPEGEISLAGRTDLAKHWTLSAALASVLGSGAAVALGQWKELDDSLPHGSGFSFVDIAADRSGLHVARRATDPAEAAVWTRRLAKAGEQQLFPLTLLTAQEGLSEQQFLDRYGTVETRNYRATVARIDRVLARHQPG